MASRQNRCPFALIAAFLAVTPCAANGQQTYPKPGETDESGYVPIFDGRTLTGWDGDPVYWRIENGTIIGEVTPETLLKRNSFLIWRGGRTADFELKLEYRISAGGNSGINYRSGEVADTQFALRGYQSDIDGANRYTGQNYEERGRTFLALRGDVTCAQPNGERLVIGHCGDKEALVSFVRKDDWNEVHLVARGPMLVHMINGHVMSVVIDDDSKRRTADGLLGVQVHVGPPMKVEFRNIRLKTIATSPAPGG